MKIRDVNTDNISPPRWADRFLEWYCRPDKLDEIQGDAYELFYRRANQNKTLANLYFVLNVFRFFRRKNIMKKKAGAPSTLIHSSMIKNVLLVTIRNFIRHPGHSFLSIFGLTASLACSFLILLWVLHENSFDQFHKDRNRIFKVITHVEADGNIQTYSVASAGLDVSSIPEADALVKVITGSRWPNELCFRPGGKPDECIYMNGIYSTEELFSVFSFPIVEGDISPLHTPGTIAISERMAQALYGIESPIGKTIKIDGWVEVTIASVFQDIPSNSTLQFNFVMPFSVIKKLWGVNEEQLAQNFFEVYLKSNAEVSAGLLTGKLNEEGVLSEAFKAQKIALEAYPFTDWHLKSKFTNGINTGGRIEYVTLFIIIGILVLAMGVINYVNMATARATLRAKEIGVRKVTGAHRRSLIAQFMGESFLTVLLSFLLALFTSWLLLPLFSNLIDQNISFDLLNLRVVYFLAGILMIVTLLSGLYPALMMSGLQPVRILKNQLALSNRQQFRKVMLAVQLSVSVGIIIFSGVLFRQLEFISNINIGFDRENMIRVEPTFKLLQKIDAFKHDALKGGIITGVAASNYNPLNVGGGNTGVNWPGKPQGERISFSTIGCTPEFAETFGLRILDGKNMQDKSTDSLHTQVLVSEEAVAVMGLDNPIGEQIEIGDSKCVIVGVINDFHTTSLHEPKLPVILYQVSYLHSGMMFIKYQPGKTAEALTQLQEAYHSYEPSFTMRYWFQDDTYNDLYKTEIIASRLILGFTIVALIIAIVGVVGMATFNIARKTKEISIRRVFGATIAQALGLLINEFSIVFMTGSLIAAPAAWYAANRWLEGFAYHVAMPLWIYVSSLSGMALIIATVIWLQGWRAVSTNPSQVLRNE